MQLVVPEPAPQVHSSEYDSAVKVLWVRVIQRAVFDFVIWRYRSRHSPTLKNQRNYREVWQWLFEPSDLSNGLESLCQIVGVPVSIVRRVAVSMTPDDIRKMEHREREFVALIEKCSADDGDNEGH